MSIPLILKVRPGENSHFDCPTPTVVSFQEKHYKFSAIYHDSIPDASIDKLTSSISALVLIGPTGSGKTTTLNEILRRKIQTLEEYCFTVCEVKENRQLTDLLDKGASKKYLASVPLEKQLKKHKLTSEAILKVLAIRETKSTESNANSSRSCLIVNLHTKSHTTTIVDMMGNEKFSQTGSTSNVFANTNVSAITQVLLSKTTKTRSSNLVTNLIFNRSNMTKVKFVLHLHQNGDPDLIKSSLYNIVDVLKNFRIPAPTSLSDESVKPRTVPNYARPTAASGTPKRKIPSKVLKVVLARETPSQPRVVKAGFGTKAFSTPLRLNNKGGQHIRAAQSKVVNKLTQSLYEEQVRRLKEDNEALEAAAKKHKEDADSFHQKIITKFSEFKQDLLLIRAESVFPLKQQLLLIKKSLDQMESDDSSLRRELEAKKASLESAQSLVNEKEKQISDTQLQLSRAKEDSSEMQKQYSIELETLTSQLKSQKSLCSDLQRDFNAKAEELQVLNNLFAQTTNLLAECRELVEEKSQILKVLESDLQHKEKMLADFSESELAKERLIESMKVEEATLQQEKQTLAEKLAAAEKELCVSRGLISKSKQEIELETNKAQSAAGLLSDARKVELGLKEKVGQLLQTLETMKKDKEDFARKHSDVVSYNKYIVEKYTGVLQENETMKQELDTVRSLATQTLKAMEELEAKLAKKTEEEQLKDGTNPETTEADYQRKIEKMESQHRTEMARLQRDNEDLKQRLENAQAPVKFSPGQIFDDSMRKDILKLIKKNIKSNSPTKANVLKESNTISGDKKKLKRRASSYNAPTKSPKLQTRA